jgi:hypothetical protein
MGRQICSGDKPGGQSPRELMTPVSGSWLSIGGIVVKSGSTRSGQTPMVAESIWDAAAAQGFMLAPKTYQLRVGEALPESNGLTGVDPRDATSDLPLELEFEPALPPASGPIRQCWISAAAVQWHWRLVVEQIAGAPRGTLSVAASEASPGGEALAWQSAGAWDFFGENRLLPASESAARWPFELLVAAR